MRRGLVIATAVVALGAGVAAYEQAASRQEGQEADWREIAWPFPRDGWPAGKAFRCGVAACGRDIEVYVRPKIGFCNCDRGVADDDEVDRVADLDLMSEHFAPLAPGHVVRIADMSGRIRAYDLKMSDGSRHAAFGIAVSRRCDLLVAVAHAKGAPPELKEKFLANMSSRAAETLREDLESRGPMRLSEVEAQQKEILKTVRRLADEGTIVLGGGGDDAMV